MGPAARARPSSRRSCARTRTTSGSTRGCWSRSTSSASSGPSTMELTPFRRAGPGRGRRERRAGARCSARCSWSWSRSWSCSGRSTRSARWGERRLRRRARGQHGRDADADAAKTEADEKKKPAAPTRVTLQIVPTGAVNVCLVDANGQRADRQPDPGGRPDQPGASAASASASRSATARRGCGRGKPHDRRARPLDAGRLRACGPASARASCPRRSGRPAREGRASSSPAPRCCRGSSPTATGRGCRSACASAGSRSPRS